jgi:ABC-type bacteriocin/lantibiotic exporter with double-glycine peptidase domain
MGQMDIAPLSIPLVRQDPDSDDCLRACALMVFRYFKEPVTKEEVWKNLHVYKKHSGLRGGYLQDFGTYAMKKGFKPAIYHYDWSWWNKDAIDNSQKTNKSLISSLRNLKKEKTDWSDKKNIQKDIDFARKGGIFKTNLPNLFDLDSYLKQRIPVILSVKAEWFYKNPKENYSHSIVVVGKIGDDYILRDPYLAINRMNKLELEYSWVANGAWMLVIVPGKKKKKTISPKIKQTKLRF